MIRTYDFSNFDAVKQDFMYAISPLCRGAHPEFAEESDAVVNRALPEEGQFEYISMVTREKLPMGTKLTVHCSFDHFGAPLIVFSDDIGTDENGTNLYGLHFEVVAFEEGCNVWHIEPAGPDAPRPIKTEKIGILRFPVAEGSRVEITTALGQGEITVSVNGQSLTLAREDFPASAHMGFTACEGINRFYDLTIETPEGEERG